MRVWNWLKHFDCYLTDKWTGRPYMYYSTVLGLKQQQFGGKIPWREHFGQALVSRILDFIDKDHCKKAIDAPVPNKDSVLFNPIEVVVLAAWLALVCYIVAEILNA